MEEETDDNNLLELNNTFEEKNTAFLQTMLPECSHIKGNSRCIECNVLNVIENDDLDVLLDLLGLEYPAGGGSVGLSREKYVLLGKAYGTDFLTPLMLAVKSGKKDIVNFLISCGVNVNAVNKLSKSAMDMVVDGGMAVLLLKSDSLLHSLRSEVGSLKLEKFTKESVELKEFFEKRDSIHNAIKRGCTVEELKELLGSEESLYFINSMGESALWQAAEVVNVDVWSFLNSRRMKCASVSEEESMKISIKSFEDRFNRSLTQYYFEVRGTHVMKMVAKSRCFGKREGNSLDLGRRLKELYEALDEYEETQIVLEVLQDEHDFEVVFDFEWDSVKHACIKSLSASDWGLMDFRQKRVYVGAREKNIKDRCSVLGTLSHELTHKALMVVFRNQGKPYHEEDTERRTKYQGIVQEIMYSSNFSSLDEVIRRVAENYERDLWDQELIVRVPEIIAKYGYSSSCGEEEKVGSEDCYSEDGITLLTEQVETLLKYYWDEVMPAFQEYVESIFTSNKLTVKMMSDYQRLLLNCLNGRVSVGPNVQDIEENILCHNGLKVLLVSCVELCYSHLKLAYGNGGKNVLLIGWSQYNQSQAKKEYMDGLSNGAYDLLAVRWDSMEEPKFCKRGKCYGDCLGNMFHGMSSNVILILTKAPPCLKKLQQLEYVWNDLSEITKFDILKKHVNFVGRPSTIKEVVLNGVGDEDKVDHFMMENVTSSDVSLFLMNEEVNIGKVTGLIATGSAEVIDQKCYMKRHFSGRCITFSDSLIRRYGELFVVKNLALSDLQCPHIKQSMVMAWDGSNFDKSTHFYALNDLNEESIIVAFERICDFHADKEGIHLLEHRGGKFLYIKSHGSVEGLLDNLTYDVDDVSIPEEKFLNHQICLPSIHGDSDCGVMPVIIADDPGCGKSFILNNFVSHYKKNYSGAWIVVVDLNFYAQENSPLQLSKIGFSQTVDLIEMLFKMVGHGSSSFERSMLKKYCEQDCKVIVMYDGFDEICPKYRENVLEFLVCLKSKTKVKICASTRLHERRELELKLNVISFKLIPFNDLEQVDFLCRYWKANLMKYSGQEKVKKMDSLEKEMTKWLRENFPEQNKIEGSGLSLLEIDHPEREYVVRSNKNIDFKAFAQKLILSINSLFNDFREFTRTPLHVKMFAFVLFEEDFIIGNRWDLGHLYEKFVEIKLKIFDREKALASGNVASEKSFSMARNRIFEQLENLSSIDFFDPRFFHCNRSEMYDALSIGLTVEKQEKYQFVHRTFGEYFFARWLLRRADNESVTKFWLETLFTDEGLFRVRWFIEDILHAYYDRVDSYNYLENSFGIEVTCLCRSIFLDERLLVCLNACLFGVIVSGYIYLLQYFASGYDCMFIKLLMGDQNFPTGSGNKMEDTVSLILNGRHEMPINIYPEYDVEGMRIYRHPKMRYSVSAPRHNAFTLVYYTHSKSYIVVKMVHKMFSMIEKYKMEENLNGVLEEKGLCWILPHGSMNADYRAYFEVVVDFLVRKIGFFKSSLKKSFLHMPDVWEKVYSQDMGMFRLMTRITDCLEHSDLEVMLLKNDDFFKLLLKVIRYSNCDSILEMWEYVDRKLSPSTSKLEFISKYFISRADIYRPKYLNFLTCAMVSDDVEKISLVWEIAMKVMSRETFVEWFQTSICNGRPSIDSYISSRPISVLKFVRKQLIDGHMTKDEVVIILLMKDREKNCYFLKNEYGEYVIEWHFLMHKLLAEDLKLKGREILQEMEYIYYNLVQLLGDDTYRGMNLNPPSDICVNLDVALLTFQEIVMSHPNILGDTVREEYASIYNNPVRLSILLLIHWYLELGFECLGRELLYKFSQTDVAFSPSCPNIIHKVLRCKIPCVIGFVCADFHKYLGDGYMINLLFMGDWNGDTVFHITAREGCVDSWGKFYDAARIVLKECALAEVHCIENKSGKCVPDFFNNK